MLSMLGYARDYIKAALGVVSDEEGQGMIEYALVIGVISLVLIFAFITLDLKTSITGLTSKVSTAINAAPTSGT